MSDEQNNNLQLPSREALVEMALARMGSTGFRAIEMDRRTLIGLCVRVADQMVKDIDAWRWLNVELGGSDDEQLVDDNLVYRFRDRFMPYYEQIVNEQVLRASELAVDQVAGPSITPLNRRLLSQKVAGRLLDTGAQINAGELIKLAAIVRDGERTEMEQQDLERKQRETEAKLEIAVQREKQLELQSERLRLANEKLVREAQNIYKQAEAEAAREGASADDVVAKVRGLLGLPTAAGGAA